MQTATLVVPATICTGRRACRYAHIPPGGGGSSGGGLLSCPAGLPLKATAGRCLFSRME